MNKKELASQYHNHNNCAQAINLAFKDLTGLSDEEAKKEAATYGGGRKIGCGAIMIGLEIIDKVIDDNNRKEELKKQAKEMFINHVGAFNCKDIRSKKLMPCRGCVQESAQILEDLLIK